MIYKILLWRCILAEILLKERALRMWLLESCTKLRQTLRLGGARPLHQSGDGVEHVETGLHDFHRRVELGRLDIATLQIEYKRITWT